MDSTPLTLLFDLGYQVGPTPLLDSVCSLLSLCHVIVGLFYLSQQLSGLPTESKLEWRQDRDLLMYMNIRQLFWWSDGHSSCTLTLSKYWGGANFSGGFLSTKAERARPLLPYITSCSWKSLRRRCYSNMLMLMFGLEVWTTGQMWLWCSVGHLDINIEYNKSTNTFNSVRMLYQTLLQDQII